METSQQSALQRQQELSWSKRRTEEGPVVIFHQLGGVEQLKSAETSGQQFMFQALATSAPDIHGAMMDAPEYLERGIFRG